MKRDSLIHGALGKILTVLFQSPIQNTFTEHEVHSRRCTAHRRCKDEREHVLLMEPAPQARLLERNIPTVTRGDGKWVDRWLLISLTKSSPNIIFYEV